MIANARGDGATDDSAAFEGAFAGAPMIPGLIAACTRGCTIVLVDRPWSMLCPMCMQPVKVG